MCKKKEGITTKLKRNITKEKKLKVRTQADKERKRLLAEKKRERGRKKGWIIALVEGVVKKEIKEGDIS